MKIEKINENQIRCTLSREDLSSRQIRLSELAYGSAKAKELFHEMMQQAMRDYGFKPDNTPLMIEAIPMAPDGLVLIVTKVEDPDVLDSRFSRFSPDESGSYAPSSVADLLSGADDVLDIINKLASSRKSDKSKQPSSATPSSPSVLPAPAADAAQSTASDELFNFTEMFMSRDLNDLIRAAHITAGNCSGPSSLFRVPGDGSYLLILKKGDADANSFNRMCNVISEYAQQTEYTAGMEAYFAEHLKVIAAGDAMEKLAQI